MMRRHAALDDRIPVTMPAHLWMLLDESAHHRAARFTAFRVLVAPRQRSLRRRLIATPPRRQKDDGGQEIVSAERGEQNRGRHLRQVEFQDEIL